jgi:hypothetical protein
MSSELRSAVEGCKSVRARCSNPAKLPDVRRLWMPCITAGENARAAPSANLSTESQDPAGRLGEALSAGVLTTRCSSPGPPALCF